MKRRRKFQNENYDSLLCWVYKRSRINGFFSPSLFFTNNIPTPLTTSQPDGYIQTPSKMVSTTGWKAYQYNPSMAAAVIFIILFGVTTSIHTWKMFSRRTWFFIPLVIGGYCMPSPLYPLLPFPKPGDEMVTRLMNDNSS